MAQYTQPDGIPFPESADALPPLEEWMEDQAIATQAALLRPGAVANAAARDAAIPAPVAGQSVWRLDMGWREVYFTAASGLVRINGWYPVDGATPLMVGATAPASMQVLANSSANLKFTTADLARNAAGYSLSTGIFTVQQAGLYLVTGYARFDSGTIGNLRLQINVNGQPSVINYVANLINTPISNQLLCAVGDQLAVTVVNGSASNVQVTTGNRGTTFSYLGPA